MTLTALIARPQQSSLPVFPAIDIALYSPVDPPIAETPDQQAALELMALADQPLTRQQLWFAHNLSPQEQLARLLIQHRLGFEAEQLAQWQRADFYWQQVQNQLQALDPTAACWQTLAADIARNYPEATLLKDPSILRQLLVEELLIDTHCGFYNGLSQDLQETDPAAGSRDGSPRLTQSCDRSFAHIGFLEALLPHSSLSSHDWLALLSLPWQQQLDRYRAGANWTEAIGLCRHRLSLYPKSVAYQAELAEVEGAAILASLEKAESQSQYKANARCLQKGIQRFEALAQTYPHSGIFYDYLGDLHHLHAIQLSNAGDVVAGLLAVEKALTYAPYLKGAHTTRHELTQLMEQMQAQATQIKANLRQQPNARLTLQGQQIIAQAKKGFSLRDRYLKSAQMVSIQSAVKLARAMTLWQQLPGLPAEPAGLKALALYDGLAQILQQPPPDKAGLPDDWQRITQSQPDLADLPTGPICDFLEQRLWQTQATKPLVTPPPLVTNPPVLRPTQSSPQPSHKPLLPWLFSRQHLGLKAHMAAALTALLVAGGLGLYELSVRSTRARAYAQLMSAAQDNQLLAVMDSAETFLSRTPLSGKDAREAQVQQLYTQAFVQWFLQQPSAAEDASLQRYVRRYQELTTQ